jgi:type IV fimbrial biogenesis protein FimT
MSNRKRARGVTLIELLIGTCIAGVLLASAVPGFQGTLDRLRLTTTTNDLVLAVNLARAEATARRTRVAVVPRTDNDWASGWSVFIDANDDGRLDANETVIRTFDPVPPRLTVAATFGGFDGHVLSFDHAGFPRRPGSNGMLLGRITLTSNGSARTLCISAASMRTVQAPACT